jgi:hypothetical protein
MENQTHTGAALLQPRLVRLAFDALSDDISDRRGLKWEWTKVDDDVMQEEIRPAWEAIISECVRKHLEVLDGECVVDHRDGYQYAGPFKNDEAAREWIALQPNREQLRLVMNAKIPLPNDESIHPESKPNDHE